MHRSTRVRRLALASLLTVTALLPATLTARAAALSTTHSVVARSATLCDGIDTPVACPDVTTGTARLVIALGDSVASGHHDGVCDDPNYPPYNRVAFTDTVKAAPPTEQWSYKNFAHSGFATTMVINGGTNSCGKVFNNPPPLQQAISWLKDARYHGHHNVVIISAGINNTNWVNLVFSIGTNIWGTCLGGQIISCVQNQCNRVAQANGEWTGWSAAVQATITKDVQTIDNTLLAADSTTAIIWTGYYDFSSLTYSLFPNPIPNKYCGANLTAATAALAGVVTTAIGATPNAHFVDVTAAFPLATRGATIQPLYKGVVNPYGYPHPTQLGHNNMGFIVYTKLQALGIVK